MLENQHMVPLQRASSARSLGISFFLETTLQGDTQRRDFTAWVDLRIVLGSLLSFAQQDRV
jgi:hypothetical protein